MTGDRGRLTASPRGGPAAEGLVDSSLRSECKSLHPLARTASHRIAKSRTRLGFRSRGGLRWGTGRFAPLRVRSCLLAWRKAALWCALRGPGRPGRRPPRDGARRRFHRAFPPARGHRLAVLPAVRPYRRQAGDRPVDRRRDARKRPIDRRHLDRSRSRRTGELRCDVLRRVAHRCGTRVRTNHALAPATAIDATHARMPTIGPGASMSR